MAISPVINFTGVSEMGNSCCKIFKYVIRNAFWNYMQCSLVFFKDYFLLLNLVKDDKKLDICKP